MSSNGRRSASRRRGRGQALVEFALIAPMLFLLIIGIIELGRLVFFYHTINNAAREGARYAIVHGENSPWDRCPSGPMPAGATNSCDPDGDNVRGAIQKAASPAMCPADLNVACAGLTFGWSGDPPGFPIYGGGTNAQGNDVTIHVEYAYAPILSLGLWGPINLRAEATLVINN